MYSKLNLTIAILVIGLSLSLKGQSFYATSDTVRIVMYYQDEPVDYTEIVAHSQISVSDSITVQFNEDVFIHSIVEDRRYVDGTWIFRCMSDLDSGGQQVPVDVCNDKESVYVMIYHEKQYYMELLDFEIKTIIEE